MSLPKRGDAKIIHTLYSHMWEVRKFALYSFFRAKYMGNARTAKKEAIICYFFFIVCLLRVVVATETIAKDETADFLQLFVPPNACWC